ncbi:related to transmembrane protein Tex-261 [Cephalotrichum gorgonifer]|uniref:Related to transmembrane protein Tex-261 n=1 Tax=Cephalotrichum gorgonifer TaxID=2041049 RepID=A0AAE8MQ75_9PEZI|nr:related to transmembrane protein Tex-261 [Cephalotrichum gorgonifer]
MMLITTLVGYLGSVLGFCFLTLAIASGLYYLSEIVEEHTVLAKRVLVRIIYFVIGVQFLAWAVDGLPFTLSVLSILSHLVYLGNMRRFPFVQLTDPLFIASCVLVMLNHYVWFRHFSAFQSQSYRRMSSYYDRPDVPSFTQIASFFGICVWLVPFSLFVSLSANDNVLPTIGSSEPRFGDDGAKNRRQGLVKAVVDSVLDAIGQITGHGRNARQDV